VHEELFVPVEEIEGLEGMALKMAFQQRMGHGKEAFSDQLSAK
jgi:hypothetical protein